MTSNDDTDSTEEPPAERELKLQHVTIVEDPLTVQVEQPDSQPTTVEITFHPPEIRVENANGTEAAIYLNKILNICNIL